MALVEIRGSVATTLDGYRERIVAEIDGVALRVGRLLREARATVDADEFARWVDTDLPFGMETARRLIAISAAYEKLPTETLRGLPRPWQALYALKELLPTTLAVAVEAGAVHPEMTVKQAQKFARRIRVSQGDQRNLYSEANLIAGRLMRCSPSDLSTTVRDSLRVWLG